MSKAWATRPAMGARGLGVVVALSLGVAACGTASPPTTASKAAVLAPAAAAGTANAPISTKASTLPTVVVPEPATKTRHTTAPVTATTGVQRKAGVANQAGPSTTRPSTTMATPSVTTTPAGGAPPTTAASTLAPRRQPTAAEVNQVIATVHNLLPFFTLTAAEVAAAGNQVCSAFDQGKTSAQVQAAVLNMVGAGGLGSLVPPSIPADAVSSLVNLYCPAYASKLG
jgi:hypothetical protein